MNEWKANVVVKLCNGKVHFHVISKLVGSVDLVEKLLREGANHRLLVIIDHILEELVDELDLKVGKVETCIIVAVELISKVKDDLIPLVSLQWIKEFVHHSVAEMLHLAMAGHQAVKFEGYLVAHVQISYGFMLVGNQEALKSSKYKLSFKKSNCWLTS